MPKKSIFQQLNESYKNTKTVVICLWPDVGAVGPIYGFDRDLTFDELVKLGRSRMAAIEPESLHEYPGPHVFDWPLSKQAIDFIYLLESAKSSAECEMVLRNVGWEKKEE